MNALVVTADSASEGAVSKACIAAAAPTAPTREFLDVSELDGALVDREIHLQVNGSLKKVSASWLSPGGRAHDSILAKQILGTEGLEGSDTITLRFRPAFGTGPAFDLAFDQLLEWLEHGSVELTIENAPALLAIADYFGLGALVGSANLELTRLAIAHEKALLGPIEDKVKMWRRFHTGVQEAPIDQDQGSNTAAAYSWYMYQSRSQFQAPPAVTVPAQLDTTAAVRAYASALTAEQQQWQANARAFALLLKCSGRVVYHPSSVRCPGYCQPSLVIPGCPDGSSMFGGAVGDRVKENVPQREPGSRHRQLATPHEPWPISRSSGGSDEANFTSRQRALVGVITSIAGDGNSEISVRWDDGSTEDGLWCAKKSGYALVYV
jgi:hypothetical protein